MGWDCGLALRWAYKVPLEPGSEALQSAFDAVASDAEGCGSDSLWPIQSATSHLEIRLVLAAPRCGRSMVVFTEGADSSPLDWGSASEACEIGGLGTLNVVMRDGSSERARRPVSTAAEGRLESVGD